MEIQIQFCGSIFHNFYSVNNKTRRTENIYEIKIGSKSIHMNEFRYVLHNIILQYSKAHLWNTKGWKPINLYIDDDIENDCISFGISVMRISVHNRLYVYNDYNYEINPLDIDDVKKLFTIYVLSEEYPSINAEDLFNNFVSNKYSQSNSNDVERKRYMLYLEELLTDIDINIEELFYTIKVYSSLLPDVLWPIIREYMGDIDR